MLKKIVYALALAGLASGQAFALNNAGFETGDATGWGPVIPVNGMTVVQYGTPGATVNVVDDVGYANNYDAVTNTVTPVVVYSAAVEATDAGLLPGSVGVGNHFALLETCPANVAVASCASASTFSFNLSGPVSAYGDYFLARLFTGDFLDNYNDSVTITYSGATMASVSDVISVQALNVEGFNTDSGWRAFGVPVGTQNIFVQVDNVSIVPYNGNAQDNLYNRPIVAIDYAAAVAVSPVPEADVSVMMLAGLGVLGLVARRRTKKAA